MIEDDPLAEALTPPLCSACAYSDWPTFATGSDAVVEITAVCFQPEILAAFSPVVGAGVGKACSAVRQGMACGPNGRLFKARGGT